MRSRLFQRRALSFNMSRILRREAPRTRRKSAKLPTVRLLLDDIAAGIRVLQTRDGIALSDEQILERARNIVAGLIGNYRIRSLEAQARGEAEARVVHQLDLLDRIERVGADDRMRVGHHLGRRGRPARA